MSRMYEREASKCHIDFLLVFCILRKQVSEDEPGRPRTLERVSVVVRSPEIIFTPNSMELLIH